MPERFDLVVIGAGPGGYMAALRAAQLGMKTACVEKEKTLGGTCLNVGCIPSKALLDSSELFVQAQHRFGKHGIQVEGVKLDLERMMSRKRDVVKSLTDGIAFLFKKNRITHVQGQAKLLGQGRVAVEGKDNLEATNILLATGSEPATLPFLPLDGQDIVTSTEALSFAKVPEHLLVIGGGFIGLELGSVWRRLGAKVSVIEFLPKLLPLNDAEVAGALHKSLVKQGLEIHLGTKVTGAKKSPGKVTVETQVEGKTKNFEGDKVLVAVGRRPVTGGLGLDTVGIEVDKGGRIGVDNRFRTSAAGIYAIGDLIAGPMLAHKASEEGIACVENLAGHAGHVNYDAIPSVIYTHPELASVGLTEEQVKASGREYRVGKFPFQASGRAKCMDETEGLIKVLTDKKTDRVLGVHILGPHASDLLAEAVLALEFKASAEDIARTCHAHPTLSEGMGEAARAAWLAPLQT